MSEESIFMEALKLPTPAERAAYLEQACGGDAELRHSVEQLLEAHVQAGDFFDFIPRVTTAKQFGKQSRIARDVVQSFDAAAETLEVCANSDI